jgi:hypothetical protein
MRDAINNNAMHKQQPFAMSAHLTIFFNFFSFSDCYLDPKLNAKNKHGKNGKSTNINEKRSKKEGKNIHANVKNVSDTTQYFLHPCLRVGRREHTDKPFTNGPVNL